MGYTLKIGQLTQTVEEDEEIGKYIVTDVEPMSLDTAPAYGEPTDNSNSRWPSYTSWHDAMCFVGLEDFMFNEETGLLRRHPGFVRLNNDHKITIESAYDAFKRKYPNADPGFSPLIDYKSGIYEDPTWPIENAYMVRLEWLKFWVDWALGNCEDPAFVNS